MKTGSRFFGWPATRIGKWSVGLAVAFIVFWFINSALGAAGLYPESLPQVFLIFFGIFMMLCGLASGILALIAVTRQHERSWLVWLPILAGAFVLTFLLGEFLVPH